MKKIEYTNDGVIGDGLSYYVYDSLLSKDGDGVHFSPSWRFSSLTFSPCKGEERMEIKKVEKKKRVDTGDLTYKEDILYDADFYVGDKVEVIGGEEYHFVDLDVIGDG